MNESTIILTASIHLSPLLDFVDMDGPLLLKKISPRASPSITANLFSGKPGLGVELKAGYELGVSTVVSCRF